MTWIIEGFNRKTLIQERHIIEADTEGAALLDASTRGIWYETCELVSDYLLKCGLTTPGGMVPSGAALSTPD